MTYEEWLNNLKLLENKNDNNVLKEIESAPNNPNINELLVPKIDNLIRYKLTKAINNIVNNLEMIYTDKNELDICMIDFKKNIEFIVRIAKLKQFDSEYQQSLKDFIKREVDKTYEILEKESIIIDSLGVLQMTIRNNRIKWSD